MHTSLIGVTVRLLKPLIVVVKCNERGRLTSLKAGEELTVKAGAKPGLLLARWRDEDVLAFEQDLQNRDRAKRVV